MEWRPDQSKAFQQLKNYLATRFLVIVSDPEPPLLLYVAAFDHAVSGVLVQEKEEESKVIRQPIYYILEALLGAKLNYTGTEKNCICSIDLLKKTEALLPGT